MYLQVTLSAEGKFLSVHKIILAASSKYFEEMFDVTTERQLIVLSGVKFEDLENIVEYMYKGQVNVSSENLEIFKSTAGLLQIKGFTKGSSRIHSNIEPEISRYGSKETPQTSASSMKTSIATPSQAVKPEPSSPPFLYQLNEIAELSALKETQKESDKGKRIYFFYSADGNNTISFFPQQIHRRNKMLIHQRMKKMQNGNAKSPAL